MYGIERTLLCHDGVYRSFTADELADDLKTKAAMNARSEELWRQATARNP